jgi:hypothetical protein
LGVGTLRTVGSKRFDLPLGQKAEVPLPTGSAVQFLPIAIVDGRLHMHLEMPGVNTRLQVKSGRRVVLGGPPYEDGVVIVELTPTFDTIEPGPEPVRPPASRVVQQPKPQEAPAAAESRPAAGKVQRVGAPR